MQWTYIAILKGLYSLSSSEFDLARLIKDELIKLCSSIVLDPLMPLLVSYLTFSASAANGLRVSNGLGDVLCADVNPKPLSTLRSVALGRVKGAAGCVVILESSGGSIFFDVSLSSVTNSFDFCDVVRLVGDVPEGGVERAIESVFLTAVAGRLSARSNRT